MDRSPCWHLHGQPNLYIYIYIYTHITHTYIERESGGVDGCDARALSA